MIRKVNPIAKALAHCRRRAMTWVVPSKKGKGAYNRKDKHPLKDNKER